MASVSSDRESGRQSTQGLKYRRLRLLVSAFCAIACMLLVALWGRSYRWMDQVFIPLPGDRVLMVVSTSSKLTVRAVDDLNVRMIVGSNCVRQSDRLSEWFGAQPKFTIGSHFHFTAYKDGVMAPHWLAALLAAAVGALPWIRSFGRFSLRALLIAMTAIAVLLGIFVASMR
jgi:hypothetical protein